jgi:hypothetical protein
MQHGTPGASHAGPKISFSRADFGLLKTSLEHGDFWLYNADHEPSITDERSPGSRFSL